MTGKYPQRFGHEFHIEQSLSHSEIGLPLSETTMADHLKAIGYRTALFGKWHLGQGDKFHPMARGFDEFFGFLAGQHSYHDSNAEGPNPLLDGRKVVRETDYLTDAFADRAVDFIKRRKSQPFFLYLAFNAVHTPMHATEKYLARFPHIVDNQRRTYAAMLSAMDDGVGAVLSELREAGIEQDTLIFFLGDNGAPLKERAWNGSLNEPLVGEKGMLTDGGIRVPFLAAWKGVLPAGKAYDRPVISLDVAATAVAASGLPPDPALDGVDLLPHVTGERPAAPHEFLYWRFRSQAAVLSGRWKLVLLGPDHRFLFDLDGAAGETASVAGRHPEVVGRLEGALRAWAAEQNPPGLPKDYHKEDLYFFDRHLKLGAGHARPSAGPRPREK